MKKYGLIVLTLALTIMGCEANSMCDKDTDCLNICNAYDGNHIMYACSEGACKCVSNEAMKCTGDSEADKCAELCSTYRPGTIAMCEASYCECKDPECAASADCSAKCPNAVKQACVSGFCQCLDAAGLECAGEEADAYCANLCEIYEPGSMPSCTEGSCVCKSTACTAEQDCKVLCESVGAAMTACVSGKCECIGKEALACAGEDGTSRCNKICAAYKPESLAVCQNGTCTCKDL